MTSARLAALILGATFLLPGTAFAHPGHGDASGFMHGFAHPIGGLDHVLAMVAVGLLAAHLGGRALFLVPLSFVAVMALGGGLGMAGIALPFVETAISLSVVVLGLAVALRLNLPTLAAMALVGVFALFHGHAHVSEMPQSASGYAYAAGFLTATALLHGIGIALGMLIARAGAFAGTRMIQAAGGAMALAGMVILAGAG
jgi:urease accessory protein